MSFRIAILTSAHHTLTQVVNKGNANLQLPVGEELRAPSIADPIEEEPEVEDKVTPQDSRGVGVQSPHSLVHEVRVQQAEVAEIRAGRIRSVGVDSVDVTPGSNGVRGKDLGGSSRASGCRRPPEVVRELGVPEEERRVRHVEPGGGAVGDTPVDEEGVGESRLGVGGEEPGGSEVELGVRCDRFLNTAVTELSGDGEVVEPSSEPVAVLDELKTLRRCSVSTKS